MLQLSRSAKNDKVREACLSEVPKSNRLLLRGVAIPRGVDSNL